MIVLILSLLLIASDVSAGWIKVNIEGSGKQGDAYRPELPDAANFCGLVRTPRPNCVEWSANIPSNVDGSPMNSPIDGKPTALVFIDDSINPNALGIPNVQILTRNQAEVELNTRDPLVKATNFMKPPRLTLKKFLHWAYSFIEPAIAWATTASDDFNRADSADIGANWSTSTGCSALQITTNHVRSGTADADNCEYWNAFTPANDQYAQVVIIQSDGGSSYSGPAVRINTGAKTMYGYSGRASGATELWKYVSGTFTTLSSGSPGWSVNDTFKIEVTGTSLTGKINGSTDRSTSDSSIASGRVGIYLWPGSETASARVDDWNGGDIGGNVSRRRPQTIP